MKRGQCKTLTFLLVLWVPLVVIAQKKTSFVTLTDINKVGINDSLEVTFRTQGTEKIVSISANLEGLNIIRGPYQTSSQTMTSVGKGWDSSNTVSLYYIVKPKAVGTLTIKPATAKSSKGVIYHSQPVTIQVVPESVEGKEIRRSNNINSADPFLDAFESMLPEPGYKRYADHSYNYSFNIPEKWTIKYSQTQGGYICVPQTAKEKKEYSECFEGIIFRIEHFDKPLDSVLVDLLYEKENDTWYTMDRGTAPVKAKNISGNGWTGIYHKNICGISCKGTGFHAAGGECEYLYFSNGTVTVAIETNGKSFDPDILKAIISSFRF